MDADLVKVFPIPLIIFGGRYIMAEIMIDHDDDDDDDRYDIFQNFDPEQKKVICRTLRYLAHSHGATLQFYSATDTGLVKKVTPATPAATCDTCTAGT